MKFTVKTDTINNINADSLILGIYSDGSLDNNQRNLPKPLVSKIKSLFRRGDISGTFGDSINIYDVADIKCKRVLVIGYGNKSTLTIIKLKTLCSKATALLNRTNSKTVVFSIISAHIKGSKPQDLARFTTEALLDAEYQSDQLKSTKNSKQALRQVYYSTANHNDNKSLRQKIKLGQAIAEGKNLARELSDLPGNICTPSYLASKARKLQKSLGITTKILSEKQMEELGMESLLSVSRGSREPAKLIVMHYNGGNKSDAPIVLVGKGLTFDAGGISIKPSAKMDEMKYDMCGGASVFGTLHAIASLKLKINVVGIVPSSENLPDGDANKPGDIVTSMSGTTIEILNTDAEGRLILCDALTYSKRFKPKYVIDIATLTGACVVALGSKASGLMSNHQLLADKINKAGDSSLDRVWQLPLWPEYKNQLNSNFADLANIGGREAGAITAGCFLGHFTEDMNWAHLDIAGTAWRGGANKGATGRVVPLLTQFLYDQANGL